MHTKVYLAAAAATLFATTAASAVTVWGVTANNSLISFDSAAPSVLLSAEPIVGTNRPVVGIDFRPSTGALYAMTDIGEVLTLETVINGAAIATLQFNVNASPALIADGGLQGPKFGFDFNPAADFGGASSLRIVSPTDQNLAVNVDTGAVTVATDVFYALGGDPNIVGEAYSNSYFGGNPNGLNAAGNPNGPGTTQYAIDSGLDLLTIQAFNAGTLSVVGSIPVNATADLGFDIYTPSPGTNLGFVTIQDADSGNSLLYSIDLTSGTVSNLGQIDGGLLVPSIAIAPAVIPEPATMGLFGLAGLGLLRRRR